MLGDLILLLICLRVMFVNERYDNVKQPYIFISVNLNVTSASP